MKKLICLIAVFAMLLTLCACKGDGEPDETTLPPETTIPTTTVPPTVIPVVDPTESSYAPTDSWTQVYADAVRDYLNPVEEFSWERQYDPEFVMIHFSSAVVNHRNDPYNIKHLSLSVTAPSIATSPKSGWHGMPAVAASVATPSIPTR